MQSPPKRPPDDLAEVERALSVLQGRHPDHERIRREDEEARAKRAAELDRKASEASQKQRKRGLKVAIVLLVLFGVVGTIGFFAFREYERRGRIEQAAQPFQSAGFTLVETSSRSAPDRIDADVDAGCLVAVAIGGGNVKIEGAGSRVEGPSPALVCTCEKGTVAVTAKTSGGLALLRADHAGIGGSRAFYALPWKAGATAKTDESCIESAFDAWLDAKHAPSSPVDDKWLSLPSHAALKAAPFKAAATIRAKDPLSLVEIPAESCLLAVSDEPRDRLRLRQRGGAVPLAAAGSIAWCTSEASAWTLEREGDSAVQALVALAADVGGSLGMKEITSRAGLNVAISMNPADRPWDARQLLLASAVPTAIVTIASTPEVVPDPEARLVALSFATPGALTPESPDGVYSFCEPSLDEHSTEALCVFSGTQTWHTRGRDASGGLARAKLPFWLFALQGAADPFALKAAVKLTALSRALKLQGFEPTTIEAITELPTGVEVLGRVNEDAIVAVGLAPTAPFVFPYTDGPAWKIEGPPRTVAITPLQKVTLNAVDPKTLPSKATRRSVVFRRHQR